MAVYLHEWLIVSCNSQISKQYYTENYKLLLLSPLLIITERCTYIDFLETYIIEIIVVAPGV